MQEKLNSIIPGKKGNVWEIAPGVTGLKILFVNVYFISETEGPSKRWVLVDAGLRGSAPKILKTAEKLFGKDSKPEAIILTHGHFDHVGAIQKLINIWQVPVYAHHLELPYLRGLSNYPPPDPTAGGGLITFLSRFFPNSPINLGDKVKALPESEVPFLSQWRWIATPGHSPGHVSLFREQDKTLIAGDAFVTVDQEAGLSLFNPKQEVKRPPAYLTPNWIDAEQSVIKLAQLQPEIAATGHGLPMRGPELTNSLNLLATMFKELALPKYGRYVAEPAITNETGIVRVPPPVPDIVANILVTAGISALAGFALFNLIRKKQTTFYPKQNRKKRAPAFSLN